MSMIIIKTVMGNWKYYLGKDGRWEGLRCNALIFQDHSKALTKLNIERNRNPKDKVEYKIL